MPIEEAASTLLGGLLRLLGTVLGEIVLELMIRGPGYLLCRQIKKDISVDSGTVLLAGVAIWVALGTAGWYLHSTAPAS